MGVCIPKLVTLCSQCCVMKTSQFRSIGPIILTDFSQEELEVIRRSDSRPGTKIQYVMLQEASPETRDSFILYAKASEKLSAVMWRKQLGVTRLKGVAITPLVGLSHAALIQLIRQSNQRARVACTRQGPSPEAQQDVARIVREVGHEMWATLQALKSAQVMAGNLAEGTDELMNKSL